MSDSVIQLVSFLAVAAIVPCAFWMVDRWSAGRRVVQLEKHSHWLAQERSRLEGELRSARAELSSLRDRAFESAFR